MQNIYPSSGQGDVPRNTSILVTFMEEVDLANVCVDGASSVCACDNASCNKINPEIFRLFKKDLGDACSLSACPETSSNVSDIQLSFTSDKKTLVLVPLNYLGSSTEYTDYTFKVGGKLKKTNGTSMFSACSASNLEVSFMVSNLLDLSPPIVNTNGIFPLPDNEKDLVALATPAVKASALIEISSCPQAYSPASLINVSPAGPSLKIDYKGKVNNFKVVVPSDAPNKAQLFNGENNSLLGIADWNLDSEVVFPNYFSFKATNPIPGNIWEVNIRPEVLADTLRLNDQVYTFSDKSVNNSIAVVTNCSAASPSDLISQASIVQAVISGNLEVESSLSANKINLKSKVAGSKGNNIALEAKSEALKLKPFSGGVDEVINNTPKDRVDRPRNSAIQFNFNEAVNPMTVSGSADEVSKYIRVLNYNKAALPANSACSNNSDCLSYKCENSICLGSYLSGRFMVSNNYKTVEFLTDDECGLNACGDKIYCLPANSHLKVEISAANLQTCTSSVDCSALSPFTSCLPNIDLGYNTCQNPDKNNYPVADIKNIDGVVDAAANSFDGDRSKFSFGPVDFYNENQPKEGNKKDNYSWSFYVTDKIDLTPPKITMVSPRQDARKVSLAEPIKIHFNKLMLNSTLTSGSVNVLSADKNVKHNLINLRSASPSPLGFWMTSENIDTEPLNGEPDLTITTISHSPFSESLTFYAQVGSGVKDIYQNCYKPSIGPGCSDTDASCCFGKDSYSLDENGNCRF